MSNPPFHLEDFLPYRLYQAAERASEGFHALYGKRYDLTRTEWRVLFNIGQYGPISASGIVAKAGFHKTQVSRAIARLEARRWVERLADEADRRTHDVRLTAKGRAKFDELARLAAEYNATLAALLGPAASRTLIAQLAVIEDGR